MYQILPYTRMKAKRLNLIVKPSTRRGKKIDVFNKSGEYLTSIGDKKYYDYPSYLKWFGKSYADKRRKLYKIRHKKDISVRNSRGWFANMLLW